jgi:hypothetical protein
VNKNVELRPNLVRNTNLSGRVFHSFGRWLHLGAGYALSLHPASAHDVDLLCDVDDRDSSTRPLMLAMGLWLLPVRASIETILFLLLVWMVVAFYLVRRMSRPGGRLSQERQESN